MHFIIWFLFWKLVWNSNVTLSQNWFQRSTKYSLNNTLHDTFCFNIVGLTITFRGLEEILSLEMLTFKMSWHLPRDDVHVWDIPHSNLKLMMDTKKSFGFKLSTTSDKGQLGWIHLQMNPYELNGMNFFNEYYLWKFRLNLQFNNNCSCVF